LVAVIPVLRFAIVAFACATAAGFTGSFPAVAAENELRQARQDEAIGKIREVIKSGDLRQAFESLSELDQESAADLSLEFVWLAGAGGKSGTEESDLSAEQIRECYRRAIESIERTEAVAAELPADAQRRRLLIQTAVARHWLESGQLEDAAETLRAACEAGTTFVEQTPAAEWRTATTPLIALGMQAAWKALNNSQPVVAEETYLSIAGLLDQVAAESKSPQRSAVLLGLGWATALQPERETIAAERLQQFVDEFPAHADAPRAAAMRIDCLIRREKNAVDQAVSDRSSQAIIMFLNRWPRHELCVHVVEQALADRPSSGDSEVSRRLAQWANGATSREGWSADFCATMIASVGDSLDADCFSECSGQLLSTDRMGHATSKALHECVAGGQAGLAESLATQAVAAGPDAVTKMAQEAACRWAGRTQRWSLLALAAEKIDLSADFASRSVHVDRLFAEALTQTGRKALANQWWSHLVDRREASDVATLLRCAELAVAVDSISVARARIDRLRRQLDETHSAGETDSLADLLEADLAIREVDFTRARALFEGVVRAAEAKPSVRARAQWMIGETHFMQHQFAEAIDAYRRVEGLNPGGEYVAASLVQAGKAFEQLGRTRDASVCYETLLGRFADSHYATEARRRIASLPSKDSKRRPRGGGTPSKGFDGNDERLRR
jgi:tetratricopeptide (TPR) repeat protein